MRDSANAGPALGSEAVDAEFWALICGDEELLHTEFDGMVSEPAEHPTLPPPVSVNAVDRDRPARFGRGSVRAGRNPGWISRQRAGRACGHQRSPPDPKHPAPLGVS